MATPVAIRVFRERPNFIPQPDSLTIDEACWSAALHGVDKPYKLWLFEIGEHREVTFSRIVGSVVERGVNLPGR